ncbi:AN1-type zinc finger protein 1 [Apophysomyces sp. BC1034]|nr:AN1-type zinc finger protein 1 [Apophysomyces sp. BC1034]
MSVSDEGDHLEAILNHREWDGQIVKYHCKWVGHDIDAATWEEASYIQSQCPQEVKKYWRAFKRGQPTNLETTRNAAEIEEKLAFLNDMKDWEEEVDCVAAIERAKRSGLTVYVIWHRYPSSHACQSLNARDERKEQRRLAAQETIKKTFKPAATTTTSTAKRKTASKTSSIVELMKAKAKAKGNTSIPMASRLYLNVQFPKESNIASAPMFFDKTSSIGKVLDTIADACSIKNLNHCLPAEDGQRLDLYSEDMTLLEKSQSLAKILSNLDTIILERKEEVM